METKFDNKILGYVRSLKANFMNITKISNDELRQSKTLFYFVVRRYPQFIHLFEKSLQDKNTDKIIMKALIDNVNVKLPDIAYVEHFTRELTEFYIKYYDFSYGSRYVSHIIFRKVNTNKCIASYVHVNTNNNSQYDYSELLGFKGNRLQNKIFSKYMTGGRQK